MPRVKDTTASKEIQEVLMRTIEIYGVERLKEKLLDLKIFVEEKEQLKLESVKLDEVRTYYFTSAYFVGLSPETQRGYKSEFNVFVQFATKFYSGEPTFEQLMNPIVIKEYLSNYISNQYTHSRKCGFLSAFFRVIIKYFYQDDTFDNLKLLFKPLSVSNDEEPKALKINQLLEIVELSQGNYRNFVIVMTFLSSGIRLSELTRLTIGDIIHDAPAFKVAAKGRNGMKVKRNISALGYTILNDYIEFTFARQKKMLPPEEYQSLFVFSASEGKRPLCGRTIQGFVKDYINKATTIPEIKKKDYCVHTFRHCFAVYALDCGIDIYTLSRLLGHNDIKTTSIYLKLFTEQLEAAIEKHPFAKGLNPEYKR